MPFLQRLLAQYTLCLFSLATLFAVTARPQGKPTTLSPSPQRQDHVILLIPQRRAEREQRTAQRKKIEINLDALDAKGLRGPKDGKVAVSYEFCIPDTKRCRAEVKRLDTTVDFMPGSRGRIGAQKGQCLCIGSTHQAHWRIVLDHLAALSYVPRIIEAYFE